jgi:hypothetical protein
MKFDIDDKVVTATGRVGKISHCRKDKYRSSSGKIVTIYNYEVHFSGAYSSIWYKESEIRLLDKLEDGFEQKFELLFLNLMIDKYLDERKFDIVKYYLNYKNEILKCGGGKNDLRK